MEFVPMREWKLHLCAFYDHTRYSIGYGTKSYPWECITHDEALRRYKEAIQWRLDNINNKFPNLKPHQQAAILSLYYNCNSCYLKLPTKRELTKNDFIRRWMQWTKYWKWLLKRANAERDLFNYWIYY